MEDIVNGQPTYSVENFFIIRSPLLPLNKFNDLFNFDIDNDESVNEWINQIKNNSKICEAIFISSPSLYFSLLNWRPELKRKKKKNIILSLIQYLIRMSTRPTPYGIFSGVSFGRFDRENQFTLNSNTDYKKRTRPDMNWLLSVIKELERDYSVVKDLTITFNNLAYKNGNRYTIPYNSQGGVLEDNENQYTSSVRNTIPLQLIMEYVTEKRRFSDVLALLTQNFKEFEESLLIGFIQQLIQQDLLVTELRPSLLDSSPLENLISVLSNHSSNNTEVFLIVERLRKVKNLIEQYDKESIGDGLETIVKLDKYMRSIYNTKNTLQVDMKLTHQDITIKEELKEELSEAVEITYALSNFIEMDHLSTYKDLFLEKYGNYREVPIIELMNEDIGIGAPPTYSNPIGKHYLSKDGVNTSNKHGVREEFLFTKLLECLKKNDKEISISKEEISKLQSTNKIDKEELIEDIELFSTIKAESIEQFNKGNYEILMSSPNSISNGLLKSVGRFYDLPDTDLLKSETSTILKGKRELYPNHLLTQVTYFPQKGSIANVMLTQNNCDYEIPISTNDSFESKNSLPISDILVGLDGERFYLKSQSLNKEIKININSMINVFITPNIFRFIFEVSLAGKKITDGFNWGSLSSSIFLPRVRVGKVVLSFARWRLNDFILSFSTKTSFEKWMELFWTYKKKWNLPTKFYIVEGDNRLLIDSNVKSHLFVLYNRMLKLIGKETLILEEVENENSTSWAQNIKGQSFNLELVFPMKKSSKYITNYSPSKLIYGKSESTHSKLISRRTGSDWFYIKLYISQFREDEFLCDYLLDFCEDLITKNIIKKYFFVRYNHSGSHIRLRLNGDPDSMARNILPNIKKWTDDLYQIGLLRDMEISTYEREVERYGGPEIIELAEHYFFHDSKSVIQLLKLQNNSLNSEIDLIMLATLTVLKFLEKVNKNTESQMKLLDRMIPEELFYKEFRSYRSKIERLYNCLHNNEEKDNSSPFEKEIINIIEPSLNFLEVVLEKLNEKPLIYNSYEDILLSILHLHLNRLLGVDRSEELKVICFTKYTLKSLMFRKDIYV
ncbi:lantibiotic dehydratase [Priestia aryabhattai]|uniref:lantibiotic dehydratase n=1 Tax=Priestia aryabhattai TaxID=412384 RepID=UPI003B6846DF